jgi:hypothetical protein
MMGEELNEGDVCKDALRNARNSPGGLKPGVECKPEVERIVPSPGCDGGIDGGIEGGIEGVIGGTEGSEVVEESSTVGGIANR